jgi:hypothetical protein
MTFSWPHQPTTEAEFEKLMRAIDFDLNSRGFRPAQRPLTVGRLLWEAFGWGGNAFPPKDLALQPGFEGQILLAKAYRWYDLVYADQLNLDSSMGYAPVRLGNAIWKVRFGVAYGRLHLFLDRNLGNPGKTLGVEGRPATRNMLCAIDHLPQGLADRLTEAELRSYGEFYAWAFDALIWREQLPRMDLLNVARGDYDASTQDTLGRRYGQARWGAQQATEKTIKGLLKVVGTAFPTGADGHRLLRLGELLSKACGITIPADLLNVATCSAGIRYGEQPSTEEQALSANHAFLGILAQLRTNPNISSVLAAVHKTGRFP